MSIQEDTQQTTKKNLAHAVINTGNGNDPVALLITAREGRGQPKNVRVEDKTIVWECEDGVIEQIGFPKAPASSILIKSLHSKAGIMILNPGYEENDVLSGVTIRIDTPL